MKESSTQRPDLSVFDAANAEAKKPKGKKLSWEKRVKLIESQFPNVLTLDWRKAFDKDIELFAWIMQDILKADGAPVGRSGPRPAVDYRTGAVRLRQLMGQDYSVEPFKEAFRILTGGASLTAVARKTQLVRANVYLLLKGAREPSAYEMEAVAKAYSKPPGYFVEYRRGLLLAAIADKLDRYPDATVKYWREMTLAEVA